MAQRDPIGTQRREKAWLSKTGYLNFCEAIAFARRLVRKRT